MWPVLQKKTANIILIFLLLILSFFKVPTWFHSSLKQTDKWLSLNVDSFIGINILIYYLALWFVWKEQE